MILLLAIPAGLLAGFGRAWLKKRPISLPEIRLVWLVIAAFLIQGLAFWFPWTRSRVPDWMASWLLVGSTLLLLLFAVANLRSPGFWLMTLGALLNSLVILANGGWMPVNPEMLAHIWPDAPAGFWQLGSRFATSKDIVLEPGQMRLPWLSDQFLLPGWAPGRWWAFSAGDALIALGIIVFFWSLGSPSRQPPAST